SVLTLCAPCPLDPLHRQVTARQVTPDRSPAHCARRARRLQVAPEGRDLVVQIEGGDVSTGAIIAIVIGAILLLAVVVLVARVAGRRRLEGRREAAGEQRDQAQTRSLQAETTRAEADQRAARAQRAEAEAEEKAALARKEGATAQQRESEAQRQSEAARTHHVRACRIDPDVSDSGEEEARKLDRQAQAERFQGDAGAQQPVQSGRE